jgi:hypothetical protein
MVLLPLPDDVSRSAAREQGGEVIEERADNSIAILFL